jgi:hypothetical protein
MRALAATLPNLPTAASGHFTSLDISGSALADEHIGTLLGQALAGLQGLRYLNISNFAAPVPQATALASGLRHLSCLQVRSP